MSVVAIEWAGHYFLANEFKDRDGRTYFSGMYEQLTLEQVAGYRIVHLVTTVEVEV